MVRREDFFTWRRYAAARLLDGALGVLRQRGQREPDPVRATGRILVFTVDRLGDILVTLPGVAAIRRRYPRAELVYLTAREGRDLVRAGMGVDEVLSWDGVSTLRELRGRRFDLSVSFHADPFSIGLHAAIGARRRIGPAYKGGARLLTDVVPTSPWDHIRRRVEATVRLLGCAESPGLPQFPRTPAEEAWAEEFLQARGVAPGDLPTALAPGALDPAKQWPLEYWQELARALLSEQGRWLLLLGGATEVQSARRLADGLPAGVLNATGLTTLGQLAALISRARILIAVDSVARHLAVAVGTPAVILQYAGDRPETWGSYGPLEVALREPVACSPCGKVVCPRPHHECMRHITPDRVLATIAGGTFAAGCRRVRLNG